MIYRIVSKEAILFLSQIPRWDRRLRKITDLTDEKISRIGVNRIEKICIIFQVVLCDQASTICVILSFVKSVIPLVIKNLRNPLNPINLRFIP